MTEVQTPELAAKLAPLKVGRYFFILVDLQRMNNFEIDHFCEKKY
jgi:hypothetical protein